MTRVRQINSHLAGAGRRDTLQTARRCFISYISLPATLVGRTESENARLLKPFWRSTHFPERTLFLYLEEEKTPKRKEMMTLSFFISWVLIKTRQFNTGLLNFATTFKMSPCDVGAKREGRNISLI